MASSAPEQGEEDAGMWDDAHQELGLEDSSLLVVVLDVNPAFASRTHNALEHLLQQLLIFVNAVLTLRQDNSLAFICSTPHSNAFVFPSPDAVAAGQQSELRQNIETTFSRLDQLIVSRIRQLYQTMPPGDAQGPLLAGALSLALCYCNRILKEQITVKPRILVLSASPDVSSQYIPIMNTIFSAQKMSIPVDNLILTEEHSIFLQQASHLTNGIYFKHSTVDGLLQILLTVFLPDVTSREHLVLPYEQNLDFRAACFCHKKIIDMGYVCSVCLSIYCSFCAACTTCSTKFSFQAPPIIPKKAARGRRKAKATRATSSQ